MPIESLLASMEAYSNDSNVEQKTLLGQFDFLKSVLLAETDSVEDVSLKIEACLSSKSISEDQKHCLVFMQHALQGAESNENASEAWNSILATISPQESAADLTADLLKLSSVNQAGKDTLPDPKDFI